MHPSTPSFCIEKPEGPLYIVTDCHLDFDQAPFEEFIEMLERLNPEEQNRLQSILLKARTEVKEEEIVWAVEQSERCGALDAARLEAQNHALRASSELSKMPQGSPRKILEALLGFLAEDRKV